MSAHHSTRMHLPLKTVFGKIGDTYQSDCNSYKMHAMATHHRGAGQPLDIELDLHKENQEIESTQYLDAAVPEEMGHLEDPKHNHHTKLLALTRKLDDLCQWVQDEEGCPKKP